MWNWIKSLFGKKNLIDTKSARAIYATLEKLGNEIIRLEEQVILEKNCQQVLIGAILLQHGNKITVDNKYIEDMQTDFSLFVTARKNDNETTFTLEKKDD